VENPRRRGPSPRHRRFSVAIVLLALSAGASDALSFAGLGGVFTSVMTGNLIVLGVAVGRLELGAAILPAVAIAAYTGGVLATATWLRHTRADDDDPWPALVTVTLVTGAAGQAVVLVVWLLSGTQPDPTVRAIMVSLLAAAMGVQGTAVNTLAIPGAATTYLTGTLTVLATEVATGGIPVTMRRRLMVLAAALAGAAACAALLWWWRPAAPAFALSCTLTVIALTWRRRQTRRTS
jgi:uncharacterized membrane protein YoaK (UPF0700 family)